MRKKVVIPLLVFIILDIGLFFLFKDALLKKAVITVGEKIVNAKVDIQGSKVTLFPLGFILKDIKVANQHKPMENLFEAQALTADISLWYLFSKKVIIDEIGVQHMSFHTPRVSSGALHLSKNTEEHFDPQNMPAPSAPASNETSIAPTSVSNMDTLNQKVDFSQLLDKKSLKVDAAQKVLSNQIKASQTYWEKKLNNNHYQNTFNRLNEDLNNIPLPQINSLQDLSKLGPVLKQYDALRKEYQTSISSITTDISQLNEDIAALNKAQKALQQLAKEDLADLEKELKVNHLETGRIAAALFGPELSEKLQRLLRYFNDINDKLPRLSGEKPVTHKQHRGVDVHFKLTKKSLPSLWIKRISFSGQGNVKLNGQITNISTQQEAVGATTQGQFNLLSDLNNPAYTIEIETELNRLKAPYGTHLYIRENKAPLPQIKLLSGESPLTLESGLRDASIKLFIRHNMLNGFFQMKGFNLNLSPVYPDTSFSLPAIVYQTLSTMEPVLLSSNISGPILSPKFSIQSNLDAQVKRQLKQLSQNKIKQEKKALKVAMDKKLNDANSALSQQIKALQRPLTQLKKSLGLGKKGQGNINNATNSLNTQKKEAQSKVINQEAEKLKQSLQSLF